ADRKSVAGDELDSRSLQFCHLFRGGPPLAIRFIQTNPVSDMPRARQRASGPLCRLATTSSLKSGGFTANPEGLLMALFPPIRGRVLVVDDDPVMRGILQHLLATEGHEVVVARTGSDALNEVYSRPPDLIMLDLSMPGMDGLEVCQQLKSNPSTRLLPI